MKYPKMLTVKSSQEINRSASRLARKAGRNRSEYVRDVIKTLDQRPDLQEAVNEALPEPETTED
jgi:predicted transcriptional regulator